MRENKELLIVIPAYNEEKNIQRVLDQLERNEIAQIGDILIMNDASRDSTERLVSQRGYRQIVNRSGWATGTRCRRDIGMLSERDMNSSFRWMRTHSMTPVISGRSTKGCGRRMRTGGVRIL